MSSIFCLLFASRLKVCEHLRNLFISLELLDLKEYEELSEANVKQAYKSAMKMNHPDNYANDDKLREYAEKQSRLINEAKDVLMSYC